MHSTAHVTSMLEGPHVFSLTHSFDPCLGSQVALGSWQAGSVIQPVLASSFWTVPVPIFSYSTYNEIGFSLSVSLFLKPSHEL